MKNQENAIPCTIRTMLYFWRNRKCSQLLKHFVKFVFAVTLLIYVYILLMKRINFPKPSTHYSGRNRSAFVRIYPTDIKRNVNKTIQILLWTRWFDSKTWDTYSGNVAFQTCPVSNCELTHNKSELKAADVVLFHHGNLFKTHLPCSILSYHELPVYRRSDQTWIVLTQEPYSKYCRNDARFNGVFNWTATYRRDSDVYIPYGRVIERETEYNVGNVSSTKTAGIAWMAGNCNDDSRRQLLVNEIEQYMRVDKFGFCGVKKLPRSVTLSHYKFYLSFENSLCIDYITEKFFRHLMHNVLPIVLGGADYSKVAPPHSYIDVRDFASVKDLVNYIKYLDNNDTAYNSYFHWTRKYEVKDGNKWCSLCKALNDSRQKPFQVYSDLKGWFSEDTCKQLTSLEDLSRRIEGTAARFGIK